MSYYEQTTPYPLGNLEEDAYNDFVDPDDFGEGFQFDGNDMAPGDSSSEFNGEIVQAFNPYVKVVFKQFENVYILTSLN